MVGDVRSHWSQAEIREIYDRPLLELVYQAATVHRRYHNPREMQVCKLISIKTGGCPEDCKYCSQSAHYETPIRPEPLLDKAAVVAIAQRAKESGVSRVCMGAAWREVRDNAQFDRVLDMVQEVTSMGLEVCCTLGMLTEQQAQRLEQAGLYAYNHNLDTSRDYYSAIITTRTYDDRLNTIDHVRKTKVTVCSGGILGMGETVDDRLGMLYTLSNLQPHPESVPINVLSKVPGTPLGNEPEDVAVWDVIRMVATARILMPQADIRLSTGRANMTATEQALCFMAGANSIFSSDDGKMLTEAAACPGYESDRQLMELLGFVPRSPFSSPTRSEVATH